MQSKKPAVRSEALFMANRCVISHPSHSEVQSVLSRGTTTWQHHAVPQL